VRGEEDKALFSECRARSSVLPGAGTSWVDALREQAASRFEEVGLPGPREEVWRHTPLKGIGRLPFLGTTRSAVSVPEHVARRVGDAFRVVMSESGFGVTAPNGTLPSGLAIRSLADELDRSRDRLGALADLEAPGITALNTALFDRGILIELDRNTVLDRPIHVVHSVNLNGDPGAAFPRVVVVAGGGSHGVVLEHYVSRGEGSSFTAPVTEIFVGPNAQVDHVRLQEESAQSFHLGRVVAAQESQSRFRSWSLALGSRLARVDVETRLLGEGADCTLQGIFAGRDDQHLDHYTRIDHQSPHTSSRETYKGILDGRARGVFLGHILVRPDAQKIEAMQNSRSVVLSDHARVNMKPWLEIYADDVRCTHGSTVGRLDDDALFYLRSRAIDLQTARALLLRGFAWEVLERLPLETLRSELDAQFTSWLGNGKKRSEQ
jgi:Fe-S cluster assembly protein SufD